MSSSDSLPTSSLLLPTATTSDMMCFPSPSGELCTDVNLDELPKINPNTGLVFPEGRIWQEMTENMDGSQITIEPAAAVYMTGVLEYLTYTLIEQSVVEAGVFEPEMNDNKSLIHPRHVMNAIKNNRQLKRLCHELSVSPSTKLQSNGTQSSEFVPFQPQILINGCQISSINDEEKPTIFNENRLNVKRKINSSYLFDESLSSSADAFNKDKTMQSMNSLGYDSDDEEIQQLMFKNDEPIDHKHSLTSHGWLLSNERIHLPMNEPIFNLFKNNISFINGLLYIPNYLRMDELHAITNEINAHEWKELNEIVLIQNIPLVNIYQMPSIGIMKETYFQNYCNFCSISSQEIAEFLVKLVKKIVIEFDLKWSKNQIENDLHLIVENTYLSSTVNMIKIDDDIDQKVCHSSIQSKNDFVILLSLVNEFVMDFQSVLDEDDIWALLISSKSLLVLSYECYHKYRQYIFCNDVHCYNGREIKLEQTTLLTFFCMESNKKKNDNSLYSAVKIIDELLGIYI